MRAGRSDDGLRVFFCLARRLFRSRLARSTDQRKPLAAASMSLPIKHPSIRTWCLPLISALATLVAAAAVDPEQNSVRLRALAGERRAKLVENLKKFDLLYSRQKQDSLRELDRRIHDLPPEQRAHYLDVLRRYHNWLNQLPENKQDELNEQPPAERMAAVKKLVAEYPITKPMTPRFVRAVGRGRVFAVRAGLPLHDLAGADARRSGGASRAAARGAGTA